MDRKWMSVVDSPGEEMGTPSLAAVREVIHLKHRLTH